MYFVALDLETTGLSPDQDTIIEIAAIRFRLEKDGDGKWTTRDVVERSMLIDPLRPLSEEVTMITGIRSEMLRGREQWEGVRERVREFIGDAVIVGHNVLFDIAMLRTHGLDLANHTVFDTFELSEIFSQEAESLNLLFLAKHYGLPIAGEHRALDDTRLSVGLFLHYLDMIENMEQTLSNIWGHISIRDESGTIGALMNLTGRTGDGPYQVPYTQNPLTGIDHEEVFSNKEKILEYTNLVGIQGEEEALIRKCLGEKRSLLILTPNKKQSHTYSTFITSLGLECVQIHTCDQYCSFDALAAYIERPKLSRKESIFSLKMLQWTHQTKTGLLDELKYYGEEYGYLEDLRCEKNEGNQFRIRDKHSQDNSPIIITEIDSSGLHHIPRKDMTLIRDIGLTENSLRRSASILISFRQILQSLDFLHVQGYIDGTALLIYRSSLSMIENILIGIPERPKGESEFPPGAHGETYHITQESLWHRGEKWLVIAAQALNTCKEEFRNGRNILDTRKISTLTKNLDILTDFCLRKSPNTGTILMIQEGDTRLHLIPRSIRHYFGEQIRYLGDHIMISGAGILHTSLRSFFRETYGIDRIGDQSDQRETSHLITGEGLEKILTSSKSSVILSTSNKHIRELSQLVRGKKIFTQGISGGKAKILSLFRRTDEEKVLIGIIDNWIDESSLWKEIDSLIIAKIPFEPPTDPYFLARTVGMRNNFEEYSCPMMIIYLNTLIQRAKSINPALRIYCLDDRLEKSIWGSSIRSALI